MNRHIGVVFAVLVAVCAAAFAADEQPAGRGRGGPGGRFGRGAGMGHGRGPAAAADREAVELTDRQREEIRQAFRAGQEKAASPDDRPVIMRRVTAALVQKGYTPAQIRQAMQGPTRLERDGDRQPEARRPRRDGGDRRPETRRPERSGDRQPEARRPQREGDRPNQATEANRRRAAVEKIRQAARVKASKVDDPQTKREIYRQAQEQIQKMFGATDRPTDRRPAPHAARPAQPGSRTPARPAGRGDDAMKKAFEAAWARAVRTDDPRERAQIMTRAAEAFRRSSTARTPSQVRRPTDRSAWPTDRRPTGPSYRPAPSAGRVPTRPDANRREEVFRALAAARAKAQQARDPREAMEIMRKAWESIRARGGQPQQPTRDRFGAGASQPRRSWQGRGSFGGRMGTPQATRMPQTQSRYGRGSSVGPMGWQGQSRWQGRPGQGQPSWASRSAGPTGRRGDVRSDSRWGRGQQMLRGPVGWGDRQRGIGRDDREDNDRRSVQPPRQWRGRGHGHSRCR